MTTALQPEWELPDTFWRWILLAMVPIILAAGAMEQSAPSLVLPDKQSYRTPLSNALFESSKWRAPAEPEMNWRQPRSPSVGWRTKPSMQLNRSHSKNTINLFPRYQSRNPYDFDYINREEKPLIKVFEFGS